ncbi:LacI family DNA-binding transcriptional regulator [Roseinatronobacter sp. S2]|uniref:LacI family DNA-binding transcriptional regulator n=1 Tax=Roseinatronobacter sp. S2 TaxID=3035471 RepID=UPI00240ECAF4|nr:LacI family DNA-binding transcriptional regulator [Roseinatronobacter sp. S2]WFE77110.1 LacI family DNA-binding transcriptional regulator [Roseinatronobacter sp. S2]
MTGIRALADRLNISIGTVSRALNDKPGVNPETRARVLKMAQEIGYVANAAGRNLRKGRTNTIGLMIGTGPTALGGDNFFMAVTDAMQRVLLEDGIDLVLLPVHRAMDPVAFLHRTLQRGLLDGVILTATQVDDPRIALMARSSLPFMTLGRSRTPGKYLWMDLDFEEGARHSVMRLAELGHRRIAVCVPTGNSNLAQLYCDSWRATMGALGLPVTDDLSFVDDGSEDGGARVAARLLAQENRPTAILMCSEPMTSGFYGGLLGAGVRPGADVSVVGFRQSPLLRHLAPPITCFDMCLKTLGQDMASAILTLTYGAEGQAPPTSGLVAMDYVETPSVQAIKA